ncbi:MAG: CPCC family cysteine-rich protein [Luteolibacter sp.]
MTPLRHPCSCCGYRTLPLPAGGTMEICPVCFWEDVGDGWQVLDLPWLADAQAEYILTGAITPSFLDSVRAPLPEEQRSVHWLSAEGMRERTIHFINTAFEKVLLGGGINLRQQQIIDDWGAEEEVVAAASKDPCARWQDIPDAALTAQFGLTLTYLDQESIRFHLPAFMRYILRHWSIVDSGISYLLSDLAGGPESTDYFGQKFHSLDENQRQAVAAFLCYFTRYDHCEAQSATKGLEAGWDRWLPDFVRLAYL